MRVFRAYARDNERYASRESFYATFIQPLENAPAVGVSWSLFSDVASLHVDSLDVRRLNVFENFLSLLLSSLETPENTPVSTSSVAVNAKGLSLILPQTA